MSVTPGPSRAADSRAPRPAAWQDARLDDAEAISAIEQRVHTLAHERIEVFREKIALFSSGCRVAVLRDRVVGYGLAYPWRSDDVPPLDRLLGTIPPDAGCLFLHDVAVLPEARASGLSGAFVEHAALIAAREGLSQLALVAVYGTDRLWGRHGFEACTPTAASLQLAPYGSSAVYMRRLLG